MADARKFSWDKSVGFASESDSDRANVSSQVMDPGGRGTMNANIHSEATLFMRSVKTVGEGEGIMYTVGTRRSYKDLFGKSPQGYFWSHGLPTSKMPASSTDSLCRRFVRVIGSRIQWESSFLWGAWVTCVLSTYDWLTWKFVKACRGDMLGTETAFATCPFEALASMKSTGRLSNNRALDDAMC
ncbi:hypothetical protein K458DRAFT_456042 [Lentithecium fluviatile CBS 122367]|uniref:Uncharacterized protein n=1 Tax=Lentithecium fluviatile CBS 122367 TaxID=1168545 RepID=A0A6G1IV94_9PLEO|nr:hypothetical protein K458DRAFT_456042 [Lentithecium fluviatile CBS 122367]